MDGNDETWLKSKTNFSRVYWPVCGDNFA